MLNSKQRQYLKGLAHRLEPVLQIGGAGLSPALLKELDQALTHHELLKLRLPALERVQRMDMAHSVAQEMRADVVQSVGRVLILYRPGDKIRLP